MTDGKSVQEDHDELEVLGKLSEVGTDVQWPSVMCHCIELFGLYESDGFLTKTAGEHQFQQFLGETT